MIESERNPSWVPLAALFLPAIRADPPIQGLLRRAEADFWPAAPFFRHFSPVNIEECERKGLRFGIGCAMMRMLEV